jgi:hypothetical protein
MAKLHDFKITGRTSASANGTATGLVGTATVEYHDDGSIRFATAAGEKVIIQPCANTNKLLKILFTGAGGFTTGKHLVGA